MKKVIVFDFDGVLADSIESVYKMNVDAAAIIGKRLSREDYLSGFEGHINERLAESLNLSPEEKEQFVAEKARLFPKYSNSTTVKLFDSSSLFISQAADLGELWVASSSPSEVIRDILQKSDLDRYFTLINGKNRQPKEDFFRQALLDNPDSDLYFITDTVGDIKAARLADPRIKVIAVTWGFHSGSLLESFDPDYLANNREEVLQFIRNTNP